MNGLMSMLAIELVKEMDIPATRREQVHSLLKKFNDVKDWESVYESIQKLMSSNSTFRKGYMNIQRQMYDLPIGVVEGIWGCRDLYFKYIHSPDNIKKKNFLNKFTAVLAETEDIHIRELLRIETQLRMFVGMWVKTTPTE